MRAQAERAALREDAAGLLGELGGTAREVALSLCAFRLRGTASGSGEPSVASYIHVVVSADTRVKRVRLTSGWLVLKQHQWWSPSIWLRLPRPIREFIASAGGEALGAAGPGAVPRRLSPNELAQTRARQPRRPASSQRGGVTARLGKGGRGHRHAGRGYEHRSAQLVPCGPRTNRAHSPVPLCTATLPAVTMAPSASWSSQW